MYIDEMMNIQRMRSVPRLVRTPTIHVIPSDYWSFGQDEMVEDMTELAIVNPVHIPLTPVVVTRHHIPSYII